MVNLFTLKEFGQTSNCMGFWGSLIYIALITLSVVISPIPGKPFVVATEVSWDEIQMALVVRSVSF